SPAELDREVRRAFDSYAGYWVDLFRLPVLDDTELATCVIADGLEHVHAARRAGAGAIMALPHLGSWDLAGAWLVQQGFPLTVVVEPLDPPELLEWFASRRQGKGFGVVPLGPQAAAAVLR